MVAFPVETQNGIAQLNGTQVATFRGANVPRFIDRANVIGPVGSTAILYVGGININFQRDGTSSGASDTADYPSGLFVPAANTVYIVWNISTPQGQATIQWRTAQNV